MQPLPLDIAFWNYDRVQALVNRSVTIDGVEPRFHTSRIVTEIFEGMIGRRAYDVAETGMTYLLRAIDHANDDLIGIPVFPNRAFRHSAIYVNRASGIERPADLAGKRIGELALYGHDAGVMPKGILADEFGFAPSTARWLIGGIDFPMKPIDFVAQPHPGDVEVEWASAHADLGQMLEDGEIDALISADIPQCVLAGSPKVGRLFEDYVDVEREYFARTGIFPIMHTVSVRRELAEKRPDVVTAIYRALCEARDAAMNALTEGMTFNNMATMIPWLPHHLQTVRETLGARWWPYGLAENRAAIDAVLRYHHEQGLTTRHYSAEEIFVPYLLDT
jgi:ABC-type nitrate/sulfonate/bicarbonate transport system substrate-binding protein